MKTSPVTDHISLFLIILALLFAVIRFVRLEADFPPGIETGTVLYSDEGWYCNGAINQLLYGKWYREGDFNPAVNLPINHIIQGAVFAVFGMSLATARGMVVFSFFIMLITTFLFVRKLSDSRTAAFTVFILSVNFITFAYSRLAILEIVMMTFLSFSLLTAVSFERRNAVGVSVCSSLTMVIAILTKSTAAFTVPLLLYLVWQRGKNSREKMLLSSVSLLTTILPLVAYTVAVSRFFPEDYAFFTESNFATRLEVRPPLLVSNALETVVKAWKMAPTAGIIGGVWCGLTFVLSRDFRKNRLVHLSGIWIVSYIVMFGITYYHPLRYFLPLAVPAALLFSVAVIAFARYLDGARSSLPLLLVTAYFLVFNGFPVVRYLATAPISFITMARQVKRKVTVSDDDPVIIGNLANSISLATGIRSINISGTRPVEWKIRRYPVDYYISLGFEPEVIRSLFSRYTMEPVGEWNVFRNYFLDKKVRLVKLREKPVHEQ